MKVYMNGKHAQLVLQAYVNSRWSESGTGDKSKIDINELAAENCSQFKTAKDQNCHPNNSGSHSVDYGHVERNPVDQIAHQALHEGLKKKKAKTALDRQYNVDTRLGLTLRAALDVTNE